MCEPRPRHVTTGCPVAEEGSAAKHRLRRGDITKAQCPFTLARAAVLLSRRMRPNRLKMLIPTGIMLCEMLARCFVSASWPGGIFMALATMSIADKSSELAIALPRSSRASGVAPPLCVRRARENCDDAERYGRRFKSASAGVPASSDSAERRRTTLSRVVN